MKYPASPLNLQTHDVPSPFLRTACRLLLRSFATISHPNALFSITCSLFSENTRVGGASALPRHAALRRRMRHAAPLSPCTIIRLHILSVTTGVCPLQPHNSLCALRASGFSFALCFQYLTNPSQSLIDAKTIYSHTLTNPFSRNPFVFSSIQNPGVPLPTNQVQRVILEAI